MRLLRLVAPVLLMVGLSSAALADSMRYFSYDADSDSAKWRTGDVTIALRKGILSRRIDVLFRRKGSDLPLTPSDAPFQVSDMREILRGYDPDGVKLYGVEPKAGSKFMPMACQGKADKAWIAVSNPKPYKKLFVWVVRWDDQAKKPALCVEMHYRFRGEWQFPPTPNRAAEEAPYASNAAH